MLNVHIKPINGYSYKKMDIQFLWKSTNNYRNHFFFFILYGFHYENHIKLDIFFKKIICLIFKKHLSVRLICTFLDMVLR